MHRLFLQRGVDYTLLALCSSLSLRGVHSEKSLGRPFLSDAIDDLLCPCDTNFRTFWFDIVSQMVENNDVRGCFFIVKDGFLVSAIVYDSLLNGEESSGSIFLVLEIPISRILGLRVLDFGESWLVMLIFLLFFSSTCVYFSLLDSMLEVCIFNSRTSLKSASCYFFFQESIFIFQTPYFTIISCEFFSVQ